MTAKTATGRKGGTQTVPDVQRGGVHEGPDRVKALLLYGTDTIYPLLGRALGVEHYTLGSDPMQDIAIASPFVSARHCRLYPTHSGLKVVDQKSKNGVYFEGRRKQSFEIAPGQTFFVGARSHQLLALSERMQAHYPALAAILGYEDEHVIQSETPSPSELIVAAVDGPHMLITSEPRCEQEQLARIIHEISLLCERPLVAIDHAPGRQDLEHDLIQHRAATVLLNLHDNAARLPATFTARLFSWRYQTRVIALASTVEVASAALGERHVKKMKHIWLEPLSGRAKAIHRLLDLAFRERGSTLRVAAMTAHNQAALRGHPWAGNFASLHQAADRLMVIAQHDSLRGAARILEMKHNTLTNWYKEIMQLKQPLLARRTL